LKVVVLGASRGIGRALARLMAGRGDALYLLGRNLEELAKSAADLEQRGATGTVGTAACDLEDPASFDGALAVAEDQLGGLDAVVVTAGLFATQEALEADREFTRRLLDVDFARTVEFCELARSRLLAHASDGRGGKLCVFSSVAGDRGRKPVVLYGAAKAGLAAYLEGLDHKYHAQGLQVICVKPGFVKTGMTAGLDPPPFAGEADAVARQVLKAIDRGKPLVYTPGIWRWVMLVIRWLPRAVMRRINF